MGHRQVVFAQHGAAIAHALDAGGVVAGDVGLTLEAAVLQFDAAAAGDLLGTLEFLLDFKNLLIGLAVHALDNRLGEHVDAAL